MIQRYWNVGSSDENLDWNIKFFISFGFLYDRKNSIRFSNIKLCRFPLRYLPYGGHSAAPSVAFHSSPGLHICYFLRKGKSVTWLLGPNSVQIVSLISPCYRLFKFAYLRKKSSLNCVYPCILWLVTSSYKQSPFSYVFLDHGCKPVLLKLITICFPMAMI